jgi:hypothetical protein
MSSTILAAPVRLDIFKFSDELFIKVESVMANAILFLSKKYNFEYDEAMRSLSLETFGCKEGTKEKIEKIEKKIKESTSTSTFHLPYNGGKNDDCCSGLKENWGLYTQCKHPAKDGKKFCKVCQNQADKNNDVPTYGTIEDRCAVDMFGFVDPSGKKPACYSKIMKKFNYSKEDVLAECARNNIVLDERHFESFPVNKSGRPKSTEKKEEPEKGAKGRPRKEKKVTEITSGSDLFEQLVKDASETAASKPADSKSIETAASETADSKSIEAVAIEPADSKSIETAASETADSKSSEAVASEDADNEAVDTAKKEAVDTAKKEAVDAAKKEAVDAAKKEADKAKKEADKAKIEVDKKAKKESDKKAKKESEETAKKEAADKARKEAEDKANEEEEKEDAYDEETEDEEEEEEDAEKEETPDVVKRITYEGKKYLKSKNTGIIYNEEQDVVGKWNDIENRIDFQEEDDEHWDEE